MAGAPDVIMLMGADGRFRYVSAASHRLFGWDPSELVGRSESDFVHRDDAASLVAGRAATAGAGGATTMRYRFRGRDGSYSWVESTARATTINGAEVIVTTLRDIGDRQARTTDLERQAGTDPLTGVANRPVLMDRLRQGLLRLGRAPGVLTVLYVDLDRFKVINDSLGHGVGDTVLLKMAERLTRHLRSADTLGRLGGDEFVIVAEGLVDERAALDLANRVILAGREPFLVGEEEFECTVSVGVATTVDSQRSAGDLLHEADLALYRAKNHGRDRAEVFDEDLRNRAVGRLVTERLVRSAIDESRIVVEYQPIIDLRTARAVSVEALVRIRDPDIGLVYPASFLEVAEETGLLTAIDDFVLADAVQQATGWRSRLADAGQLEVAINVSARHLADVGFQTEVLQRLDAHGLPHGSLQVEVTERVLMEASNSAMTGLRTLRDAGVRVGLDHFGTGYSSLAYLRHFPLDCAKIDKSFIDDLERDQTQRAIVAAIIRMAHALELIVVAEGVESQGQQHILEQLDCDRAQGFLFAVPAEPTATDALVLAQLST